MITGKDISMVIPVFNESVTIGWLLNSLDRQTLQPGKVIFVDAGSTDNTADLIRDHKATDPRYVVIEAGRAMPGKARNIGAELVKTNWIAFTDAGIRLEPDWLAQLVLKANELPAVGVVYGNYNPVVSRTFEKAATIAYVAPKYPGKIRGKFIASCLMKKEAWEAAGGFPDLRAAEDLILMESIEKKGVLAAETDNAVVHWQLRQTLAATFKRFDLYSMYNVWAGRQAFWHYGLARLYSLLIPFILLGIFWHYYWFFILPVWALARVGKRFYIHRHEYHLTNILNPVLFFQVLLITLLVDMATFTGWFKALIQKPFKGTIASS
jgi:glycosyltransferase involved in cell wall biosynthesis